ncbi:vWA domain-containing protein [Paludisphaera mucosa]|uniref:VWA domain-containing protein n=1 Tax=Paludisphaera mucosa TaxID=3030827 RepID=A0ABT6F9Z8_9BACT|nr:VWA domain-containing protein [Paludisphaera mucosa]MDG3004337.1 VWA domain-containing protein [Paludisphaera mucosa]
MPDPVALNQRQMLYWRLLAATSGLEEAGAAFEATAVELADRLDLPRAILDPGIGVDVLIHRHPKVKPDFDAVQACIQELPEGTEPPPADADADLRRTFAYSKLLLNVFGPNTRSPNCTAAQYNQWCQDVAALERCMGMGPGSLRPGGGGAGAPVAGGSGAGVSGNAPRVDDHQLREELVAMESDLVKRMDLREVLKDDRLAAQLSPTLPLVEQLLRDKSNLTGPALANARRLIKKYVDDLAAVLKRQVFSAKSGEIDASVPPKRVYRNLDLKRTVWKNLPNYNPEDGRLYVDRLFYRRTAQKSLNKYLIVVVDQSGSMVDAMVQCAILASIFATLPRVVVSLVAFDTNVIDLSAWAADPFESLMRTDLGGGNDGPKAMLHARGLIFDPRRTTMVWISDFYEFQNDRPLFEMIKAVKQSGVHFIPVGSVSGKGYFSVNEWFRKQLKGIGLPVLTGNIKKLIVELKKQLR